MKISHNIALISSVTAAILLSGCGSASSDNGTAAAEAEAPAKVVTVERGPLLDANVTDADGQRAVELGAGRYAFDQEPQYPITAKDGYIDVDRDGVIDPGEVRNTLELKAGSGDVVTVATTLAVDSEKAKVLQEKFDISTEEIETKTPSDSLAVEAFSNTLYAYSIENGYAAPSEISKEDLEKLADDYRARYDEYQHDEGNVSSREEAMMSGLSLAALDDADAEEAQSKHEEKIRENEQQHTGYFDLANGQSSVSSTQNTGDKVEQGLSYSSVGGDNEQDYGSSYSSAGVDSSFDENHSSAGHESSYGFTDVDTYGKNNSSAGQQSSFSSTSSDSSSPSVIDYGQNHEASSSSTGTGGEHSEGYSSAGADYTQQHEASSSSADTENTYTGSYSSASQSQNHDNEGFVGQSGSQSSVGAGFTSGF